MLLLSINAVALHDVIIVMGTLKGGLHASELVLYAVQLNTRLFTGLTDLAHLLFLFAQLKVHALVFVGQLLGQGVLKPRH